MSSAILTVQKSTTIERRRAISLEADERQERIIGEVQRSGFSPDSNAILSAARESSDPLATIERRIREQLASEDMRETILALVINGRLLATLIQQKHERLVGLKLPPEVVVFAEEAPLYKPEGALRFWQRLLGLTDEQMAVFAQGLGAVNVDAFAIAGRVSKSVMESMEKLYRETIGDGMPLSDFLRQAGELLPNLSRNALEAEYRTKLTQAYGGARHELIVSRSNAFPFTQFFAIIDSRTTWNICLPMGTAGPGGRGYIAASEDPLWFIWRPPNHYSCRSDLSPIGYRECQRLGILDAQGRKIALVGNNPNRPFGDPPRFAQDPVSGTLRSVTPQEGFGA